MDSLNKGISTLDKKTVINYFNLVQENTSARNRNSTRIDLSTLIQVLVYNEKVKDNFVTNINIFKSPPEGNKTTLLIKKQIFYNN
jgi:hypothetical protein